MSRKLLQSKVTVATIKIDVSKQRNMQFWDSYLREELRMMKEAFETDSIVFQWFPNALSENEELALTDAALSLNLLVKNRRIYS